MFTVKEASLKVDKARWFLLKYHVFYGALASRLTDVFDPREVWEVGGRQVEATACTDGRRIIWSMPWLEKLSDEETRGLVLHELCHCSHGHLWRLPSDEDGNLAADHEIDPMILTIPDVKLPDGGHVDPRFAGLAAEEILALIRKNKKPGQQPGKPASLGCGGFEAPAEADPNGKPGKNGEPGPSGQPGEDPGDGGFKASLREEWTQAVQQAEIESRRAGSNAGELPADLRRILERARAVEVDWRRETAEFVRSSVTARNDWSRSNRRHATAPVIYPRRKKNDLGVVLFWRDTSGSISLEQGADHATCVTNCIAETGCSGIVADSDTEIKAESVTHLEPGDECPAFERGGGGTAFAPALRYAAQLAEDGEQVSGLIFLTDGDASDLGEVAEIGASFEIPTLWVIGGRYATKESMPFGRTIHMPREKE